MSESELHHQEPDDTEPIPDNDQCEYTDRGTGQCPERATTRVFIAQRNTTQRLCDKHAQAVGPDGRDSEVAR